MKQYPFPERSWGSAAFGVMLFSLLLLARDTLMTSIVVGFYKSQFLGIAIMGILGIAFVICNRGKIGQILQDRRMLLILCMALLTTLIMIVKGDWQMMYFSILLCMVFPVFMTYFTDSGRVAKYYIVLLAALGVYSLITTYLFRGLIFSGVLGEPGLRTNSAGMEFYDFGLCFAVNDPYWHRNFGIFREPGVYQFFLILGIYLNHYQVQWRNEKIRWALTVLLTVTMISTYSIVGFAELGLFAVFLFFDKGYYRTKIGRWLGAACVAAVVAVIVAAAVVYRIWGFTDTPLFELYDMFVRLTTDSESSLDRVDALMTNVRFYLNHPLVGEKIAPVLHGTAHNTSSTLLMFATMGTLGGVLHIGSWAALLWKKERNLLGNLTLMLVFLMSFNTQNLTADVFFWLFPCMALAERGLPLIKKKET